MTHRFVEFVPAELDEGVLYVSIPYCTVVHRCACGCRCKVVTPISPADWQLNFDGEGISLNPSIGNWGFPCRSHYWVTSSVIRWAPSWTDDQIARGCARDHRRRTRYFADRAAYGAENGDGSAQDGPTPGWLRRWRRAVRRIRAGHDGGSPMKLSQQAMD